MYLLLKYRQAIVVAVSMFFATAIETLTSDRDNVVMPLTASLVYLALACYIS